jgi:hypothetical protein
MYIPLIKYLRYLTENFWIFIYQVGLNVIQHFQLDLNLFGKLFFFHCSIGLALKVISSFHLFTTMPHMHFESFISSQKMDPFIKLSKLYQQFSVVHHSLEIILWTAELLAEELTYFRTSYLSSFEVKESCIVRPSSHQLNIVDLLNYVNFMLNKSYFDWGLDQCDICFILGIPFDLESSFLEISPFVISNRLETMAYPEDFPALAFHSSFDHVNFLLLIAGCFEISILNLREHMHKCQHTYNFRL